MKLHLFKQQSREPSWTITSKYACIEAVSVWIEISLNSTWNNFGDDAILRCVLPYKNVPKSFVTWNIVPFLKYDLYNKCKHPKMDFRSLYANHISDADGVSTGV